MKSPISFFKPIQKTFSISETSYFKGIGIIMIIFHNYLHILPGMKIENEFVFDSQNIYKFISKYSDLTFLNVFASLFAFLGHYGVQIFLFFSAYGLTIQYSKWKQSSRQFTLKRLKKIYFLMLFAILFCLIFCEIIGISYGWLGAIIRALILGSTLNSFTTIDMLSGPYWFFATIIQFYLLFPFLYRLVTKFEIRNSYIPIIASLILVYGLYFTLNGFSFQIMNQQIELSLLKNIFGHLPEVLLGITMAHFKRMYFHPLIIIFSFFIFIISQYSELLFPLSFLSMTILLISFVTSLEKYSIEPIKKVIRFIGKISMILFIVNGPLRSSTLFMVNNEYLKSESFYLFLIILFALSYLLYLLYSFLVKKLKV